MSPLDKALLRTMVHGPDHSVTTMDDEVKDRYKEEEKEGDKKQPQLQTPPLPLSRTLSPLS